MILRCMRNIGGIEAHEKNQITQMSYKCKQLKISIFGTYFVAHSSTSESPADVIKTATKERSSTVYSLRGKIERKMCDGSIKIARRGVKYQFKRNMTQGMCAHFIRAAI